MQTLDKQPISVKLYFFGTTPQKVDFSNKSIRHRSILNNSPSIFKNSKVLTFG